MSEFDVYFRQVASASARKVEAEDYDEAIELAWDKLPGSLCHQCACEVELAGEWEPDAVVDADGKTVREERWPI